MRLDKSIENRKSGKQHFTREMINTNKLDSKESSNEKKRWGETN
jgi:hypothetical protein